MKNLFYFLLCYTIFASISFGQESETAIKKEKSGLLQVSKNRKWGYVDTTGKLAIKYQFDKASRFVDGLAIVEIVKT